MPPNTKNGLMKFWGSDQGVCSEGICADNLNCYAGVFPMNGKKQKCWESGMKVATALYHPFP